MFDATEMTERFTRGLAEFSELCLASARDLVARQVAAENAAEAASCAAALHKVGRSLRQSMALEARLRRDRDAARREAQAELVVADEKRRKHRRAQVEAAVGRLIWTEAESEQIAEGLMGELDDLLNEELLTEAFGEEPLETHIARLLDRLGVIVSPAPAEERRRSSA